MDSIGIFHSTSKKPEKVIAEVLSHLKSGKTDNIPAVVEKYGVLQIIDPLLTAIRQNAAKYNASKVIEYAKSPAFGSNNVEMVKFGIALLGLFDWGDTPEMQEKLLTLGMYEELTLYVLAAARGWHNGNDMIFKIAQRIDGWGKIHAAERLEPETDEIREWILLKQGG